MPSNCINSGRSARVRRAIVDKGVHVPAAETIGYNLDRQRFTVTASPIVVIPKGFDARAAAARTP